MKRMIALLLVLVLACACVMPTAALESFGTTVDPASGEEYPILPSVEDFIPEEPDEIITAEDSEEEEEALQEPISEEETEYDRQEDLEADAGESAVSELHVFAEDYDTSELGEVDLSSRRILVSASEDDIVTEEAVIAELDGLYLMQFEDEDTAKLAYLYYNDQAEFAEVDSPVVIADDEAVAVEDASVMPVEMDEDENPFAALTDIVENEISDSEQAVSAGKVIALIDTGMYEESRVIGRYSVIGDDVQDDNGHGSAMVETVWSVNPDAEIISIKAVSADGTGSISSVYAAVQLAMELHADIINLSVYAKKTSEASVIEQVLQSAIDSGITVVGAAGNSGADASNYVPGCVAAAEIASAVDTFARLHSNSNYGDTVDYYVMCKSSSYAAAVLAGYLSAQDDIKYALASSLILEPEHVFSSDTYISDDRDLVEIYTLVMNDVTNGTFTVASNDISRLITSGTLSSAESEAIREHYGISFVGSSEVGLDYTSLDEALESGQFVTADVFDIDKVDHWIYTTNGSEAYPSGVVTYKYVLTAYDSSGRVLGSFTATCTDPKKSAPSGSTTVYNYNAAHSMFTKTAALIMFSSGYFGWNWSNSDTTKAWGYITDINTYVAAHEMMALAWHGATPSNVDSVIETYSKFTSSSRRTQIKNAYLAFYEAAKTSYSWMKQYTVFYMSSSNSIYQTLVWMAQTATSVSFSIQKRASSTSGTLLPGATFKVYEYDYDDSEWKLFATLTNSSSGYYSISGMTSGLWYQVRETAAPSGYQINDNNSRYFVAPSSSGTIPTFYNTPTESSSYAISNGHIFVDTPVTTTPPPSPATPTPTAPPEPLPDLGTLTITKVGNMVKSKSSNWKWVSGSSKWASGNLSGVTFEVWTGSTPVKTNSGTVIFAANTKVTNKAAYGVSGFNSSGQVVTGSNGKCSVTLPYGSYVIKEVSTPIGYVASANQNVTISSSSTTKTITNTPVRVAVRVTKKDANSGDVLAGAVFGLYAGENIYTYDGKTLLWAKDALIGQGTSGTNGQALYNDFDWLPPTSVNRTTGYKYYVKEISPPDGYKATDYVYEFTASTTAKDGKTDITYTAEFSNTPFVSVRINKITDEGYASMVSGNGCYNVAGAQFVLYESMAKAQSNNAADRVSFDNVDASGNVTSSNQTVLTVGSNGYTPYMRLEPGKTYYVREIRAGKGYELPEGDKAIRSITVSTAAAQAFSISNIPATDPVTITLEKSNYAGDPPAPLTGAQFRVQYYPGTYTGSTLPSAATKTWVIQTVKSGNYYRASFDMSGSIVASKSDSFWLRTSSGVEEKSAANLKSSDLAGIRFPFGTYVITEIQAAPGYLNDPTFEIGGHSRSDRLVLQIRAKSDTDPTPVWTLADGSDVTDLPVSAANTAAVSDTVMPTVTTTLAGRDGDGAVTKTPVAKHSVSLTDTVTISTLNDFQRKTIRVEGRLYLLSLDGRSTTEIGNGTVTGSTTVAVDELTEEVSFTYTFNAWELYGRTLVACVEVYDADGRLIASHTDINEPTQQIAFRETGNASFFKHGEQLTGVTYNPNGTASFVYEDVGLTGVTFRVVAAEDIRNVHGELLYRAGQVVLDDISPSGEAGKEGMILLTELPFGSYLLKETASDGKHTLVEDTPFIVNADTGEAESVDHDIPNTRKTVTVSLDKVESVNQAKPVPGAKYALYANENVVNYKDDKVLDKDVPVAYAITDESGRSTFITEDGVPVDLPVGFTWYVKELYVPAGFDLDDTRYAVSFTDTDSDAVHIDRHVDGDDGDGKVTDAQQPGEIVLTKLNASGNRLAGTTYVLEYALSENGPWSPVFYNDGAVGEGYVAGSCDSEGLASDGSLTTGSDGVVSFTGLLADGTVYYRVTEIRTPDGYQLLSEHILVGTLPRAADETLDPTIYDIDGDGGADIFDEMIVSRSGGGNPDLAQLKQFNSDMRKHDVAGGDMPFNRRYILNYTVTNSAVLELPRTGSRGFVWLPFACGGLLAAGGAFLFLTRRRRRAHVA